MEYDIIKSGEKVLNLKKNIEVLNNNLGIDNSNIDEFVGQNQLHMHRGGFDRVNYMSSLEFDPLGFYMRSLSVDDYTIVKNINEYSLGKYNEAHLEVERGIPKTFKIIFEGMIRRNIKI